MRRHLLIVSILGSTIAFGLLAANSQRAPAGAGPAILGQPTPPTTPRSQVEGRWRALTQKWISDLGTEGWLYLAYTEELSSVELGVDPETGWPLPNHARRELWFLQDSLGMPTIVLSRRQDLDRNHTWLSSSKDGVLVRHSSGVREESDEWRQFHPILDLTCVELPPVVPDLRGWMLAEERQEGGRTLYVVTFHVDYATLISGVYKDDNTYAASEFTCIRDAETGAVVSSEGAQFTVEGVRVVGGRGKDFEVRRVAEPPAEMMVLLDER